MTADTTLKTINFTNRVYRLSPFEIDTLKLIALIAMLVDHTNTIFSLHIDGLRLVGRVAFPLFGLIWAHNWVLNERKANRQQAVNRMWTWAILTQSFYYFVFAAKGWQWYDANILFCFAAASQALLWINSRNVLLTPLAIALIFATAYFTQASEYGAWGMLFLFACYTFYVFKGRAIVLLGGIVAVSCSAYLLNQRVPLFATAGAFLPIAMMMLVLSFPWRGTKRFLPPKIFYYAYAGHLALYGIALTVISS